MVQVVLVAGAVYGSAAVLLGTASGLLWRFSPRFREVLVGNVQLG